MLSLHQLLAVLVFVAALAGILIRPRGISEAWWSAGGALLMLALGVVGPREALLTLAGQWDLFLFLGGLMLISGLADAAGFFDAAAALAAGAARGSGRLLLVSIFAVGALVTAFLSNDATALILTPVVYTVVTRLGLPPLPYLFAITFVADTASTLLPVSNPINILLWGHLGLGLGPYLGHLLPAGVTVIAVNAAVFLVVFRRRIGHRFEIDWRRSLADAASDPRHLRLTTLGLAVVGGGYLAASLLGFSLGMVALGGGVLLALVAVACRRLDARQVRGHFSVALLVYAAGLMVMVRGLGDAGLTSAVLTGLFGIARGAGAAVVTGVVGAAVACNLVNNLPATLFLLSGVDASHLPPALHTPFLTGVLVGADIGPNLTPVGSLSTMLWLVIVRRRGIQVSSLDYMKLGVLVTPLMLLAATALIALTFR